MIIYDKMIPFHLIHMMHVVYISRKRGMTGVVSSKIGANDKRASDYPVEYISSCLHGS
jgi:hypothetical protein